MEMEQFHVNEGAQPAELRVVRLARDAWCDKLSSGVFLRAEVELLDSLGAECTVRGGDADVLDQLAFRLRQRLTRQLAVIAVVRRGRTSVQKADAC